MTRTPNTDYTKVGDSAFTNGNVISYEGENYYRACNYKVSDKPDGGTTYCVKHVDHRSNPNSLHEDFEGHEVPHGGESNLAQHARRELELIGEEPQFVDWYVGVIRAFMVYGHSGGSAEATIPIINKLLKHENLSELTDDPDEWYKHSAEMWDGVTGIWQNKRNSKMFSDDEGKTSFSINDTGPKKYTKTLSPSNTEKKEQNT